jgi:hypothetical protein
MDLIEFSLRLPAGFVLFLLLILLLAGIVTVTPFSTRPYQRHLAWAIRKLAQYPAPPVRHMPAMRNLRSSAFICG